MVLILQLSSLLPLQLKECSPRHLHSVCILIHIPSSGAVPLPPALSCFSPHRSAASGNLAEHCHHTLLSAWSLLFQIPIRFPFPRPSLPPCSTTVSSTFSHCKSSASSQPLPTSPALFEGFLQAHRAAFEPFAIRGASAP